MIPIPKFLMRMFRRRNPAPLQPPTLPFTVGDTVIVMDGRDEWHGKAGFVTAMSDPSDPFMLVTVQRHGMVGFFRPRHLTTNLSFACSYERAPHPTNPNQPIQ